MLIGNNPPDAQIETIILEKIRFGISTIMSGTLRNELSMVSDWEIFSDDVIRQIKGYLVGNKVNTNEWDEDVKIYPATMWEELKKDFAPQWFKRKFPVRYSRDITHHIANHYRVCPHLDVPNKGTHLRYLMRH